MERAETYEPLAGAPDPRLVLDAVDQAIIITDLDGTISFWNRAAEELYGWAREEAVGRQILEVTPTEEVLGAAGAVMEALRAGRSWSGDMVLRRREGGTFLARVTDTPILDGAGDVAGIIGVSEDVTGAREARAEAARLFEQERAARAQAEEARGRLAFLGAATAALNQTLDLDARLARLVRIGVPGLADGCAVHLVDGAGAVELVALHHRDPARERELRAVVERYPVRVDSPAGTGAAIREGAPAWFPEITREVLAGIAVDAAHLDMLCALELSTAIAVPLLGSEGPIGALTFFTVAGRRMSDDDVLLATELGARTGIDIANAQLLRTRELAEASNRYQAALLGALYDASVDGVLVVGPEGEVLSHNARFLEMWGFDAALVERGDAALLAAARAAVADPERFTAGVQEAYLRRPERVYDEVVLADGRTFDRHGAALRAEDGEHLGFAWSFRDVSVERAQRAEIAASSLHSSNLARTLQQSLLPHRLPAVPGIDLAARYHPALDGVVVGGDFYDVFPCGDDWLLVLGDVCGKGAEAAALTALIRYSVRAVAMTAGEPATVLRELNAVMLHDSETDQSGGAGRLATACCIRLRREEGGVAADVACAGHPLPLVLRGDATVEEVGSYGTILGALHDVEVSATTTLLRPGDCIIAYTDGVTEARDEHGQQFEDLLTGVVGSLAGRSAAEIGERLEARALEWQGGVARDDIAILAARIADYGVG